MGVGPDNNQSVLLSVINSAKRELLINIYQFDRPDIAQAIIDRVNAKVTVRLLVEGEPFNPLTPGSRRILETISDAIDENGTRASKLLMMVSPDGEKSKRRYRWNHAKYVIADGRQVLISSENFTSTGHAKAREIGNRGWDVVLDHPETAVELTRIFEEDCDTRYGDVTDLASATRLRGQSKNLAVSASSVSAGTKPRTVPAIPEGRGNAADANLIAAPDAVEPMLQVIRSARTRLDIEEMSLPSNWRSPHVAQNPIVTELIRAAQRGTQVRVILNDESAFSVRPEEPTTDDRDEKQAFSETVAKPSANKKTVDLLMQVAESEDLPLSARLMNYRAAQVTYVHNKGIIVDGIRTVVGSINGTQNSFMNNREIAVVLESADAARYYGRAFDFDWTKSDPDTEVRHQIHPGHLLIAPLLQAAQGLH